MEFILFYLLLELYGRIFSQFGNTAFQPFVSPGLAVQSLLCAALSSSIYIIAIQAETSSVTQCNSSID
jgi:hypothetical protein